MKLSSDRLSRFHSRFVSPHSKDASDDAEDRTIQVAQLSGGLPSPKDSPDCIDHRRIGEVFLAGPRRVARPSPV